MLRTGDLGIPINPSERFVAFPSPPPSLISLLLSYPLPLFHQPPSPPSQRSPSPEPIYSHDGKRLNTREVRVRKRLEDERHESILKATQLNPDYKPPTDYK